MRLRVMILPVMLVALLALGACGGSSSPAASGSTTTVTYQPAGKVPSVSAKMVCAKEAITEIASSLGVNAKRVTAPSWNLQQHIYSCRYVYPKGSFVLDVKELSSAQETTDYFNAFKKKFGSAQTLFGLGQGAFVAKNNDVIVRKDYKVLLVDVANIPKTKYAFVPLMSRQDVAVNIAGVIMGCWAGA